MADLVDDDRLLDALAMALRPDESSEPSVAELTALRSVVAEVHAGTSGADGARARSQTKLRRWAAGVIVGGVVLSGGTAYATNPVAPRPVRSAAFALKLPVESPELTDAKDALDDLEEELHEGRREQVAAAAEDVREELADLSRHARRALEPRTSVLLTAADAFVTVPPRVEPSSSDDDDSGGRDSSGSGSGEDEGDNDVDAGDLDDSSGSGSSGRGSSGPGSDDVDAEELDDSSGSGSGGSGNGSGGSGSGSG